MDRREFLKLVGLSTLGTLAFGACTTSQSEKYTLSSPVTLDQEYTTGKSLWYASVCRQCTSGCGITVRVMEGRAKKIEGNPLHPISQGKVCARGQAAVQALYNPDRLAGPLKRVGDKGAKQFAPVSWDEALNTVTARLSAIGGQGAADALMIITGSLRGAQARVIDGFARTFGSSSHVAYELFGNDAYYAANRLAFGVEALPNYDIANANYVLSFGADFLETGLSPVNLGVAYGNMRQGRPGLRGKLVHFGPRLSLTAANADEWIPTNPGTEGLLALGLANVITGEGLASTSNGRVPQGWFTDLAGFTPETVAQKTGVSSDNIRRLAREFARSQPGIALGGATMAGQTNGVESLMAVNALNILLGSVGVQGGVRFTEGLSAPGMPARAPTSYASLSAAADRLKAGGVDTVFVYGANPVYTSPIGLDLASALLRANFVVAFSSFMDETSSLADLILPDSTFLENWGDDIPEYDAGHAIYGTIQPVVVPLLDTRPALDVILSIAKAAGGPDAAKALPWQSTKDILNDSVGQLQTLNGGSIQETNPDKFLEQMLRDGGWFASGEAVNAGGTAAPAATLSLQEPQFDGDADSYPFQLLIYESLALGDGRGANLPWLQELPDPLTSAVWSSWIEVNPGTAGQLGIEDGDVVWVESSVGKILAPVVVFPGIMPNVVSIPLGQGHSDYGQFAQGRGVNPLQVLAPLVDQQSGMLALGGTRVRLTKATETAELVRIERNSLGVQNRASTQ